jgi:hypothetical protein
LNCSASAIISQSVSPCTDIDSKTLNQASHFIVYPNPSNGEFSISTSSSLVELRIYNSIGKKVYEQTLDANNSIVSLKGMSPGVYLIEGIVDLKRETKRLVIVD